MPKYANELANYFNHNRQRWEYRIYKGDLVTWRDNRTEIGVVLSIDKRAEWCTVQWNDGKPPEPYRSQYRQLLLLEDMDKYNTIMEEHGEVVINGLPTTKATLDRVNNGLK
tara:strand:+ start:217 stop:549 length:333 start_codon:yes stop_codon:yes gene_type:complete